MILIPQAWGNGEGRRKGSPDQKLRQNFFKPSAGAIKAVKAEKIYYHGRLKSIC